MTRVVDLWRAIDPQARLVSGSSAEVQRPVRGVARTRVAPPHLPPPAEGQLLIADAGLIGDRPLDEFLAALADAEIHPAGVVIAGWAGAAPEAADAPLPILASALPGATLLDAARSYLDDPNGYLARTLTELRLVAAEAALASADPNVAVALVAARLRRGAALVVDGELRSLVPRPAGRALAARFAAIHGRGLTVGSGRGGRRRAVDGLWLWEQRIRPGAAAWLFDDLPLAAVDEVGASALGITLRALLLRPAAPAQPARREPGPAQTALDPADPITRTLLAVARANGRIAPAARALGVHRNTVLYRLRAARAELGIDPRRPQDALALLAAEARQP